MGNPTKMEDAPDYYNDNPARFGERKQYEINEFSVQGPPRRSGEWGRPNGQGQKDQELE